MINCFWPTDSTLLSSSQLEDFEDSKGVIRIVSRSRTDQKKRTKGQTTITTQKAKDRTTRTPIKTGDELRYSGKVNSSCSTSSTSRVTLRAFIDPAIVLSMFMFSFIFVIVCGLCGWKRIGGGVSFFVYSWIGVSDLILKRRVLWSYQLV